MPNLSDILAVCNKNIQHVETKLKRWFPNLPQEMSKVLLD